MQLLSFELKYPPAHVLAVKELLTGAEEAEDMLRHQIVQGKRKGDGEYELNVDARHTSLDPNQAPGAR